MIATYFTTALILTISCSSVVDVASMFLPKRVCIFCLTEIFKLYKINVFKFQGLAPYATREKVFIEPEKRPFCNAFTGNKFVAVYYCFAVTP